MAQIDIDKFVISLRICFGENKGIATTLDRCLFSLGLQYVDTPTGGRLERVDLPISLGKVFGEQKPTDDEPKFKVDDWIVYEENIYQIHNISLKKYYECLRTDGTVHTFDFEYIDSKSHLWTIEDAKDGDVLACNEEILLFKSYSVQNRISLYCWYNGQTNNFHSKEVVDTSLTTRNKICPATKEQRDLLFQKIHEAGYQWDDEKKELRKVEKKPAWSEEDESHIRYFIECLEHCKKGVALTMTTSTAQEYISWLKSLRPQSTWKPSDEQLNSLYDVLNPCDGLNRDVLESLYVQLKKLREK